MVKLTNPVAPVTIVRPDWRTTAPVPPTRALLPPTTPLAPATTVFEVTLATVWVPFTPALTAKRLATTGAMAVVLSKVPADVRRLEPNNDDVLGGLSSVSVDSSVLVLLGVLRLLLPRPLRRTAAASAATADFSSRLCMIIVGSMTVTKDGRTTEVLQMKKKMSRRLVCATRVAGVVLMGSFSVANVATMYN